MIGEPLVIGNAELYLGDCLEVLPQLPSESVHCVVTSPPYWGLRDYGLEPVEWKGSRGGYWRGSLGLEPTPNLYVAHVVEAFRAVKRVLRDDGTVWLNMGDSYAANRSYQVRDNKHTDVGNTQPMSVPPGLKPKDLVGLPWMVAFALREDGWWLRSDIVWAKKNPMPESVRDRPTRSHEYVFLLSKKSRYYYDQDAVREPKAESSLMRYNYPRHGKNNKGSSGQYAIQGAEFSEEEAAEAGRNLRSVWHLATQPYPEAHFATYPEKLVEPCIKAGCPENGTVLDPFCGSGTTGVVALRLGRNFIGIELNPEYVELTERRIEKAQKQQRLL